TIFPEGRRRRLGVEPIAIGIGDGDARNPIGLWHGSPPVASGQYRQRKNASRQTYEPKPSQKARALAKKPSDSGELLRASFSNSRKMSRWRRVRLTGVSTVTWMYMSPD